MDTFHALLRGEASAEQTAARLDQPTVRVRAYRDFVRGHVEEVLQKNYAALAGVLGRRRWDTVVELYFRRHPPRNYELNANAAELRAMLADLVREGALGITELHRELAELEWQEWVVYADERQIPAPQELGAPALNPTLVVLDCSHPVSEYLDDLRESDRPPSPPDAAPEQVLVFREPASGLAVYYRADEALLFAVKMVHEAVPAAEAARRAGLSVQRVEAILRSAVEIGLVIEPC
jgi:hypothetical protein